MLKCMQYAFDQPFPVLELSADPWRVLQARENILAREGTDSMRMKLAAASTCRQKPPECAEELHLVELRPLAVAASPLL